MPSFSTLKKMSAASGLVFGNFLAYHLYCHYSLYLQGLDAANENLVKGRVVYQNPVIEILLLLSVLVHMYSNTSLYLYRKRNSNKDDANKTVPAELKAHRIAGYIMGTSIVGHVFATRMAPLYAFGENASAYNYGFIHTAAGMLGGAIFYIYLAVFAMAGGWHLIYGTRSALATLSGGSVANKPMPIPLKVMALTNHILIILGVLALSGYFYEINFSLKQEEEQNKFFSVFGM